MADDPTAGKCPKCGAAKNDDAAPYGPSFDCGSRFYLDGDQFAQNINCHIRDMERQLATVTAERDHFRRRYVELYSTVWGEQYADFEDSDAKHAEAMEEIDRCNCALLDVKRLSSERDRLRSQLSAMMGDIHDSGRALNEAELKLIANGTLGSVKGWARSMAAELLRLRVMAELLETRYPTARAAIYAAMGWEERSGM